MKEFWNNLKFAWKYTKEQKRELLKYIFMNILSMIISLVVPIISAKLIIWLTENKLIQLVFMAILLFIVENLRNLVHYFSRGYAQVIYRESFSKIQTELGKNILKLENNTIDKNGSGVFIQRLTNDTSRLADIFNVLCIYLTNIITNIGIFGAIFIINKIVFLYMIIMTIILYFIEDTRVKKYIEKDKDFINKNDKVSSFVGEIVRGVRDIKMLNSEDNFIKELNNKIINLNKTRYDMQNIDRKFNLLAMFIRDLTELLLIIILVVLISINKLNTASALIIYNYSSRVESIVNYIGMFLDKVKDFNLSANRIFSIINSNEFKKEKFGIKHLDKIKGDFEFYNVNFSYGDNEVLKNVSFKINANETVAFVGKSGAGKSTIFNLLCKMYDINSGSISIDGIDINELDRESIRGNITIISQNPYIFNLSIKDNLRLVK